MLRQGRCGVAGLSLCLIINVTKTPPPTLCSAVVKRFCSRESHRRDKPLNLIFSSIPYVCAERDTIWYSHSKNAPPFQGNHTGGCGDATREIKCRWKEQHVKRLPCPRLPSQPMRVKWLSGHLGNHFCACSSSSSNLAVNWLNRLHSSVQYAFAFLSKKKTQSAIKKSWNMPVHVWSHQDNLPFFCFGL